MLAVLVASCFTPDLGDGAVACGTDGLCPPDYFCHAADQRCYKTPDTTDMSAVPGADLGGATGDLANADLAACTKAACGNRNCGMILDGCGATESCGGSCTSPQTCGGGSASTRMPNVCSSGAACSPQGCQNKQCGLISDGCSSVLDCGPCSSSKTCGTDHMCH